MPSDSGGLHKGQVAVRLKNSKFKISFVLNMLLEFLFFKDLVLSF